MDSPSSSPKNTNKSTATTNAKLKGADADIISNARRLIITKMVLENFKSYAGINEIGPFHKVIIMKSSLNSFCNYN